MVHYNETLNIAIQSISTEWEQLKYCDTFIMQNIYGKISVYIDTKDSTFAEKIKNSLSKKLDKWIERCEILEDNLFAQKECEAWKEKNKPVVARIWVLEKFLTNEYWDFAQEIKSRERLNGKLVSFYSFKGGIGRTTTMVMSAIELAKRGKKVVLMDFDLEAPGVSSFFPDETISQYGVLDFLLESYVYSNEINIDEYVYTVSEYCHVNQEGGEIYIVPALGQVCKKNIELYRKNLMRFDLNVPIYKENETPIDRLLKKIDVFLKPDYIFIDTRSGIHEIGGMTLTKYSDMAILFFFGSRQNIDGMKMVLPVLKKFQTPFTLVNCKVPINEAVAEEEKSTYLEGAYEALQLCDVSYQRGDVLLDDSSAEHYPIDIYYNEALEVIKNPDQLIRTFEELPSYGQLINEIEDTLADESDHTQLSEMSEESEKEIVRIFSCVMNGLQTAAAEDEFANENNLSENFYPLKGYTFIFDIRKFLVLGQKGVGKTALFSALKNNRYAKSLAKYLKVNSEQYEYTEWIVGTSQETDWASIFSCMETDTQIKAFLYYKIIEILSNHDQGIRNLIEKSSLRDKFNETADIDFFQSVNQKYVYEEEQILKKINEELKQKRRIITIIYDALDRIVAPEDRAKFNSALIDIWYRHESTMKNIRSKIFLRQDIYDREVEVADKVKLKNYSVTLTWEYDQLFAMVWKRAICKSEEVRRWYEKIVPQGLSYVEGLKYIPIIDEKGNRDVLAALIGVRMGSGKKAATYNWFRNRLSDTQGVILPRSMLDIFASAAEREIGLRDSNNQSTLKSIIRPRCLEESLQSISEKRVTDLKEEYKEYAKFLDSLKDTIQRSPVDAETMRVALEKAGFKNPEEEITNLINIGILKRYQRRIIDPVRYHFPDIYLKGLGLQRSGMH